MLNPRQIHTFAPWQDVRFEWWIQPVDATLLVLKEKDGVYADTSRVFRGLRCGRKTRDFGIAGDVRNALGFKPQQKE